MGAPLVTADEIIAELGPLATPSLVALLAELDLEELASSHRVYQHYEPDGPVLSAFYSAWTKYVSIIGPLASGKTTCAIHKMRDVIDDMPPDRHGVRRSRVAVVRQAEADLRRATIPDWLTVFGELGTMRWSNPLQQHIRYERADDGTVVECTVEFIALDRAASIKRVKGLQLTAAYIDEAKEISVPEVVFELFGRLGRFPRLADMPGYEPGMPKPYWSGAILASNPPPEGHWLHRVHEAPSDAERLEWSTFNQPGGVIEDPADPGRWIPNPDAENLRALPPDFYSAQLASGASRQHILVNLAGRYGIELFGKPCWPEYNPTAHEVEGELYRRELPVYAGLDYGLTPSIVLFHDAAGGFDVFDEFWCPGFSAPRFARELRAYLATEWGLVPEDIERVYDDPAGTIKHETAEESAHEIMRAAGFAVRSAPVPNTDLIGRRQAVTKPLLEMRPSGQPRIRIAKGTLQAPRCQMLRAAGAGKFYYRELQVPGDQRFSHQAEKNDWSHFAEALEYGLAGRGESRIHERRSPRTESAPKPTRRPWS